MAELRRRLGGQYTLAELVELYEEGTAWAYQLLTTWAPQDPELWQPFVIDAAFATYARGARR